MAKPQSHISFSVLVALGYAFLGVLMLNIRPETILLASIIVVITGMLPNIDEGKGTPAQELGGLLAAVSPLVLLEFYPQLKHGGVSRLALIVIFCYVVTRLVVVRALQKFTVHRGMLHSIPAAIITFELMYLLFWDLRWRERMFVSAAAFVGYLSHLLLDAYGNLDLIARAMGKAERKQGALKILGKTWGSTFAMYACVGVLGWYVIKDMYPHFQVVADVRY